MPFKPLFGAHAIAEVIFVLQISPAITADVRANLKRGHEKWSALLPSVVEPTTLEFSVTKPGENPPPPRIPPLQFVRHRSNGDVEWRLHVQDGDIVINCLVYTRWRHIWGQARGLLTEVAMILPGDTTISSVSLQYTNVFFWSGATKDYDVRELLNADGSRVPAAVLDRGPYWHLHQGWFSPPDGPDGLYTKRVLDRMHIDAIDDPDGRYTVKLENLHRLDFNEHSPLGFRNAITTPRESAAIDSRFEFLHDRTKESLGDYLTADLQGSINLHAT